MHAVVHTLLALPAGLAYLAVGLLVFSEDALFFGFLIPGETAAVVGGVLAHRGHAVLPAMIIVVVAAAILGDGVGYAVGRRVGPRLLRKGPLRLLESRVRRAEDFMRVHGRPAVLLGRFVAFTRALMPALAGISEMPYRQFLAFNAIGGALWGSSFVIIGYVAGRSYEAVSRGAGEGAAIIVVVAVVVILVGWHGRRLAKRALTRSSTVVPKSVRPPADEDRSRGSRA
ncbi:MAG TPA: DedA family protein [Amnibacterium sp.]|jgi:membrane protein DedA with SNARE-associated domain|uniref:DedA family protein n=1 Tax=Amnibacterium sp. TaxID=1872496 RepID=UPI002F957B77